MKTTVKLRVEFEVNLPFETRLADWTEEDTRFYFEESTCLHNVLRDILDSEPENACNICCGANVKFLGYAEPDEE